MLENAPSLGIRRIGALSERDGAARALFVTNVRWGLQPALVPGPTARGGRSGQNAGADRWQSRVAPEIVAMLLVALTVAALVLWRQSMPAWNSTRRPEEPASGLRGASLRVVLRTGGCMRCATRGWSRVFALLGAGAAAGGHLRVGARCRYASNTGATARGARAVIAGDRRGLSFAQMRPALDASSDLVHEWRRPTTRR